MSGSKGFTRRRKGAPTPPTSQEEDRIDGLIKEALDYLETELKLLTADPGNFGEVTRIARAIQQLRPAKNEVHTPSRAEAEFRWGDVDDEEAN